MLNEREMLNEQHGVYNCYSHNITISSPKKKLASIIKTNRLNGKSNVQNSMK